MRRIVCAAFALPLLLLSSGGSPARAEEVRVHLIAHGAVEGEFVASHPIDGAHFCSAAPEPWSAPDGRDTRPAPFPFYRLVFGQDAPGAELARPGPSIGLALSNYFPAAREHSDPVNDSIELVLLGRHFVGHTHMRDPNYRFAVTYRDDQRGGGFVAHRLQESGTGHGTLDVEGNWECPPVAADLPEVEVSAHPLFPGAEPVLPEPTPLRVLRSDIPCVDRGCAGWRVTNDETGAAYLAIVDFTRLRLARLLREQAEAGQVQLLIGAAMRDGQPPRVVALRLAGVEPAHPPGGSESLGIPESDLP
jgi:hypothetical protein